MPQQPVSDAAAIELQAKLQRRGAKALSAQRDAQLMQILWHATGHLHKKGTLKSPGPAASRVAPSQLCVLMHLTLPLQWDLGTPRRCSWMLATSARLK